MQPSNTGLDLLQTLRSWGGAVADTARLSLTLRLVFSGKGASGHEPEGNARTTQYGEEGGWFRSNNKVARILLSVLTATKASPMLGRWQ